MGTVVAEMSMSLDGFVADASDGIDEVLRPDSSVTIVIDGLESAVEQAKAAAGEKMVGVGGADVAQQCLNAGLLDGIRINLVPVLLGEGVPFFANLTDTPVELEDPKVVVGSGVTHLDYRVAQR